jgi:hypothetical protein
LILLNGVWTVMPEIRGEIVACAKNRHIIVADQFDARVTIKVRGSRIFPNVVTVSAGLDQCIRVLVEMDENDDQQLRSEP